MQSVLPGSTRSTQKPIQFPVELKRSSCCGKWPNSLTISLPQATPGFDEVIVQWSKDPMLIDVCLNGQRPGSGGIRKAASSADTPSELNRVCVAGALLNEDDTVLNPHVRYHNEAMSALHAIGKAFGDAAYARSRQPLLFPQTRLETGNLIRATHDWVLFRRRRASSCDCLGTCTPIKPASTLTHICAVSWNHCGREDRLIPVHKPDGSIHAAPSLVVGFDSPIHLVDPDGCCVFTVSISFKRPLENIPEDLNHLQQFALMLQSNACFCLDGTVVPVKYEKAPKQPHRITRATVTTYPADGLAFIINDDTILKDILRSGIEFKVRVQCDFILNERKEPVDGEFLRAQFPTGDSQPGGIFESCFRLGHFKHEFGGDSVTDGTGDDIIPEGTGLDTEIPEDGSGTVINTDDPVTVDTTDGAVTPADPVGTPESGSGTVLDTDDPVTVDTTNGTVTPVDPVGTPESAGSTVVDTDDPVTVDTTDDSVTPVDSGGSTVVEPGTGATDDGEPEVDVGEVTMNVFLVPETLTSVQMLQQRATDIGGGAFLEFTDASNKLSVVTFPATAASHAESLERTRLKFQSSADPGLQLAAISVVAKTADAGAQGRIHKQTDLIRKTLQPSGPKTIVVKSHEVKLNKPVTILFPFKGTVS